MNRSVFNLAIDAIAAVVMLAMIATGVLLRFTLPPGSGHDRTLWRLTRHQWGDLHFWLALAVVAIILVHLWLHWTWVVATARRCAGRAGSPTPRTRRMAGIASIAIVSLALVAFWWASVGAVRRIDGVPRDATAQHQLDASTLRGHTTLAEAAAALGTTTDAIRDRLRLAPGVPDDQRLGQIARQQGLTMRTLRDRLESPQP